MKEFVIAFLVLITFSVGVAWLTISTLEPAKCDAAWEESGMEHKWSFFGGCRIKHDGHWIPSRSYKIINTTNERN